MKNKRKNIIVYASIFLSGCTINEGDISRRIYHECETNTMTPIKATPLTSHGWKLPMDDCDVYLIPASTWGNCIQGESAYWTYVETKNWDFHLRTSSTQAYAEAKNEKYLKCKNYALYQGRIYLLENEFEVDALVASILCTKTKYVKLEFIGKGQNDFSETESLCVKLNQKAIAIEHIPSYSLISF